MTSHIWCALFATTLLTICGCDSTHSSSKDNSETDSIPLSELNSHEKMKRLLGRIPNQARKDNEYFQTSTLQQAQAALAQVTHPADLAGVNLQLADDYRRLGENEKAVQHFDRALKIIEETPLTVTDDQRVKLLFSAGVGYLRLGETANCVHCRTGESCLLPIQSTGVHAHPEGSEQAIKYFQQVLDLDPQHLPAKWLLNIANMTLGTYPENVPESYRIPPEKFADQSNFPRFADTALARGIDTFNCGGGAIADDFDGDGDYDLLTSTWAPSGSMHYFVNDGTGKFTEKTSEANLSGILGGINMMQADYDNDGDLDVFVVRGAWLGKSGQYPNSLLQNDGKGRFTDVSLDVGIKAPFYPSSSAAWFDFDNDGDLDLFVTNEGAPCQLFENHREAGFTDVAVSAGVTNDRFAKGVTCGDVNGDRLPDIYVSNLGAANRLYLSNGDKTFTDKAAELKVEGPSKSFPTWFWDVNNDGVLDLYVSSYVTDVALVAADFFDLDRDDESDALYLGNQNGGFREVSAEYGLTHVTQPMGANFGDLDNDGFPDFYLGTGYPDYEALMPNMMFHNVQGERFENVSYSGGFAHLQKGHGTAFCDFDGDGDQDVFIQTGGAFPGDAFGDVLFENPGFDHNWVQVHAIGTISNRSAIGARIKVLARQGDQVQAIYRWVNSGGSFGANSLQQHIGIGKATSIDVIEVFWPTSNTTQVIENPQINTRIIVREKN